MHINYRFVLDFASKYPGPALDYGCGAGQVVLGGLDRGMDIYGVESFYEGGSHKDTVCESGLLGNRILELGKDGTIPFPSEHFGSVVANQVFEHVNDLHIAFREIRRVLKPSGVFLALFPSSDSLWEGHCGVPLVHHFGPKLAKRTLMAAHCLGMGYHREGKTREQWASDFVVWLRRFCFYRSKHEIAKAFTDCGFSVANIEPSYIRFRLNDSLISRMIPGEVMRRTAGLVLFAKPVSSNGLGVVGVRAS